MPPSASAPAARVSARDSSQLVCRVLRATLALAPYELSPELLRRCKTRRFESARTPLQPPPHADDTEAPVGTAHTEESALSLLWKCMYQCVQLHALQPWTTAESGAECPPPPLPLRALQHAWEARASDEDARARVTACLRTWGYPAALTRGASGARVLSLSSREALLALHWLAGRTRLLERYVALLAADCAAGWFAVPPAAGSTASVRPAADHSALPSPSAPSGSLSRQSATPQFPQPLLPPPVWDSAASLSGLGYIEQSDEYRLLQQLMREADARAAAAVDAPSGAAAAPHSTATPSSLCLPLPSSCSPVAAHESYSEQRLRQRVNQCVALWGRLQMRLKKLAELAPAHARGLAALQQLQRHPCLRVRASPYSPLELQLLRTPSLRQSVHGSLRRWLADLPPSLAVSDIDQATRVWSAWVDSVAQLQMQEDAQRDDDEQNGGRSAATSAESEPLAPVDAAVSLGRPLADSFGLPTSPLPSSRTGRSGAALPPHLRAAARPNSRSRRSDTPEQMNSSRPRHVAGSRASAPPLADPATALWRSLTHTEVSSAAMASTTDPPLLASLLRRWHRAAPGTYVPTPEERALLQQQSHSHSQGGVAPARATGVSPEMRSVRWLQAEALQPLIAHQRALSATRDTRTSRCRCMRMTMRTARSASALHGTSNTSHD